MRYKFIQSKVLDKNVVFRPLYHEVSKFSTQQYEQMKPLVLEQDIPTIQGHIRDGKFSYEDLVLFYLYRIYKYELPNETTLNTLIALNQNVLEQARKLNPNNDGKHSYLWHADFIERQYRHLGHEDHCRFYRLDR